MRHEGRVGQMLLLAYALATDGNLEDVLQDGRYVRMPYEKVTAETVDEFIL